MQKSIFGGNSKCNIVKNCARSREKMILILIHFEIIVYLLPKEDNGD